MDPVIAPKRASTAGVTSVRSRARDRPSGCLTGRVTRVWGVKQAWGEGERGTPTDGDTVEITAGSKEDSLFCTYLRVCVWVRVPIIHNSFVSISTQCQ